MNFDQRENLSAAASIIVRDIAKYDPALYGFSTIDEMIAAVIEKGESLDANLNLTDLEKIIFYVRDLDHEGLDNLMTYAKLNLYSVSINGESDESGGNILEIFLIRTG
jgi:hypothetical protein